MKNKNTGKEFFANTYSVEYMDEPSILMIYEGIYQSNKCFSTLYKDDGTKVKSIIFSKDNAQFDELKYSCQYFNVSNPKLLGRYDYIYRINNPLVITSKEKAKEYISNNGEYLQYCSPELKKDEELVSLAVLDAPLNIMYADRMYQRDSYSFLGISNLKYQISHRIDFEDDNIANYFPIDDLRNALADNVTFLKDFYNDEYFECLCKICDNPFDFYEAFDHQKIQAQMDKLSDNYSAADKERTVINSICDNPFIAKEYIQQKYIKEYISNRAEDLFSSKEFWGSIKGDDLILLLDPEKLNFNVKKIVEEHPDLVDGTILSANENYCFFKKSECLSLDEQIHNASIKNTIAISLISKQICSPSR